MANIRFLYANVAAERVAVMSASSSVTAMPPAFTQTPDRSQIWRSSESTGDQWLAVDLSTVQNITMIALANVVTHTGGSMKVQESLDGLSWSDISVVGAQDPVSKVAYAFFSVLARRYVRMYFTNTGSVNESVEVGYFSVGEYVEPTRNVIVPIDAPIHDPSVTRRSLSGQRATTVRPQQSRGVFQFQEIPEADQDLLTAMFTSVGTGTPVFAVLDEGLGWPAWLIHCVGQLRRRFSMLHQRYVFGFEWEEAV